MALVPSRSRSLCGVTPDMMSAHARVVVSRARNLGLIAPYRPGAVVVWGALMTHGEIVEGSLDDFARQEKSVNANNKKTGLHNYVGPGEDLASAELDPALSILGGGVFVDLEMPRTDEDGRVAGTHVVRNILAISGFPPEVDTFMVLCLLIRFEVINPRRAMGIMQRVAAHCGGGYAVIARSRAILQLLDESY